MKNITLAVDETVLARVRRIAWEKDTTVNALVREYLTRLAEQDDRGKKARQRLVELAKKSAWNSGGGWKWNREEIYDRPVLRGHERPDLHGVRKTGRKAKKAAGD